MQGKKYPIFTPTQSLSNKGRADWNSDEAQVYKEWLVRTMEQRIGSLRDWIGIETADDPIVDLEEMGKDVVKLLGSPQFSQQQDNRLTSEGFALVADMGLLVAKYLLNFGKEKLKWEVVRNPKNDMSYNLPVLTGFTSKMYLEPVGGSIAEAQAIVRGEKGADVWKAMYMFWKEKIKEETFRDGKVVK